MLMLSKYAVPESEKGCGIMSTSTSSSRIRQKLLIPGAFCSRGITLCGYEFAGHRYDWDKRPGWRDYLSSSSQVREKKKIYYLSEQGNEASTISSFFFCCPLLSGVHSGSWFVSYLSATLSTVQALTESTAYSLAFMVNNIRKIITLESIRLPKIMSDIGLGASSSTKGTHSVGMDYIYSVREEEGTLSHWDNKGKKTNLTCECAVRRTIDCLLLCHSTLDKTISLPPFCCMWAIIRDAAVWSWQIKASKLFAIENDVLNEQKETFHEFLDRPHIPRVLCADQVVRKRWHRHPNVGNVQPWRSWNIYFSSLNFTFSQKNTW